MGKRGDFALSNFCKAKANRCEAPQSPAAVVCNQKEHPMKTILLLHDEATRPMRLLENPAPIVRLCETEAVAGCNCDRWGHPCPRCVTHGIQPKADLPISFTVQK